MKWITLQNETSLEIQKTYNDCQLPQQFDSNRFDVILINLLGGLLLIYPCFFAPMAKSTA